MKEDPPSPRGGQSYLDWGVLECRTARACAVPPQLKWRSRTVEWVLVRRASFRMRLDSRRSPFSSLLTLVFLSPPAAALLVYRSTSEIHSLWQQNNFDIVLDVRSSAEFHGGHVPGALFQQDMATTTDYSQVLALLTLCPNTLKKISKEALRFFVYCRSSARATRAARVLEQAGWSNLTLPKSGEGFPTWAGLGFAVSTGGRSGLAKEVAGEQQCVAANTTTTTPKKMTTTTAKTTTTPGVEMLATTTTTTSSRDVSQGWRRRGMFGAEKGGWGWIIAQFLIWTVCVV